ncbi:alpha/beta hydrolase [Reyranella sp.]|uniref:alpha/beta hydrolase n=1 Tax=Reyranella sp. TaxID=1929291 RepID=UPI00261D825A|nr:alpha/beta hydrolase [Reyranella sp.]HQT11737.1 alpha/beta hydrolase [Reyranella sp.]
MSTAVHPQIEVALAALAEANLPPVESLTPAQARATFNAMSRARGGTPASIARAEDGIVPGPDGDVPVRIYWPIATGPRPALIYCHGGGHVFGDLDTHDVIARNLCGGAEVVVVAVDYRLAPEHKFPAAAEDAWAAYNWVRDTGASLGVDISRLAVGGDSAGGNLAAVVAIMARDAGHTNIKLQVLIYPVTDYSLSSDSYNQFGEGYGVLTSGAMKWFSQHYLRSAEDADDWRASPIKAKSLANLPPAFVVAAQCDVLCDEGADYAEALGAAGTKVERKEYAGMIHGFFGMTPAIDDAVRAQSDVSNTLRSALT